MASGELSLGATTLCRVGDTIEVTAEHAQVGTWCYTARILWIRSGHLGLTPPDGRWQQAVQKDGLLSLTIHQPGMTATLVARAVGITNDLPPVLVIRQEAATTPRWQDGAISVPRVSPGGPVFRPSA
jgi:hypothetical protein